MKKEKKTAWGLIKEAVDYGFADSTFESKSFVTVKCADLCNSLLWVKKAIGWYDCSWPELTSSNNYFIANYFYAKTQSGNRVEEGLNGVNRQPWS